MDELPERIHYLKILYFITLIQKSSIAMQEPSSLICNITNNGLILEI